MKRVLLIIQLILILILEGCSLIPSPDKVNGIYYWRTTYDPSTEEKWFLNEHEIRRMYIRFFDVVIDDKKKENSTEMQLINSINIRIFAHLRNK